MSMGLFPPGGLGPPPPRSLAWVWHGFILDRSLEPHIRPRHEAPAARNGIGIFSIPPWHPASRLLWIQVKPFRVLHGTSTGAKPPYGYGRPEIQGTGAESPPAL